MKAESLRETQARLRAAAIDGDMAAREELILSVVPWCKRIAVRQSRGDRRLYGSILSAAYEASIEACDKWEPRRGSLAAFVELKSRTPIRRVQLERSPVEAPDTVLHRSVSRWRDSAIGTWFHRVYFGQKRIAGDYHSVNLKSDLARIPGGFDLDPAMRIDAEYYLARIDDRERAVVTLHFGFCGEDARDLAEVARETGMSRSKVYRVLDEAVAKMRAIAEWSDARAEARA